MINADSIDPRSRDHCRLFVRAASLAAMLTGVLVLVGWFAGIEILESLIPGAPTMKANAAAAFVVAGAVLWVQLTWPARHRFAQAGAIFVLLTGGATLAQYLFGVDLGLDRLLIDAPLDAHTSHPGRMSPASALGFLLLGFALLRAGRSRAARALKETAAVVVLLVGLLALLGFIYQAESLYRISYYSSMALPTAGLFLLLSLAVLARWPEEGLITTLTSVHGGGFMARRILPFAALAPLIFGWLRLQGERAGFYGLEFGLALFALSNIATFTLLVWFTARLLNRIDAQRSAATSELTRSYREVADLKSALDEHAIVAITDPRGRITFVNDKFCALSQYSREELIGQDHRLINSGYHPEEFIRELWATISAGRIWQGEIKNRAKDGSPYWVATTIVPFLDEADRPRQYVAIRADITAHKEAELKILALNAELAGRVRQLEAANEELEAFSYSVSHDLRAPLRGLDGFARILQEECASQLDAQGQRRLGVIRSEAQRMGELIDALLAFSRLGRQQLTSGSADLTTLAHDTWSELVRVAPERAAHLRLAPLPTARGDAVLLRQVLANLLGNAFKFTRHQPAPVIEVGGTAGVAEHTYYVRDNGAGFDPRHAAKLFGVFQRLHRESEFEGTGVGLALSQRIVHRHGGRIWAEGAPGRGATFYFTLPAESGNFSS